MTELFKMNEGESDIVKAEAPKVAESPVVEEKVLEETETETEELTVKTEVNENEESSEDEQEEVKSFTQKDLDRFISRRVSTIKAAKIKEEASKLTKKTLDELDTVKAELNELKRKNECFSISKKYGVDVKLLDLTNLSGEKLEDYAKILKDSAVSNSNKQRDSIRERISGSKKEESSGISFNFNDLPFYQNKGK